MRNRDRPIGRGVPRGAVGAGTLATTIGSFRKRALYVPVSVLLPALFAAQACGEDSTATSGPGEGPNRSPRVLGALADQLLFLGDTVSVDVAPSFGDPDGDPLTFAATSADPAIVRVYVFSGEISLIALARGAATVTVTARDPAGGEAGQTFEVTVPNRAPVSAGELAGRQLYVGERATVEVSGAFSDPDGDPLTFEAVSSDTAVVRAWATGSAVEVESAARGAATVTVTARDPAGGEAGQSFEVTVPNRAPVSAGDLAGRQLYVGERATVEVSGAFSDPDGDPLTFEAVSSDTAVVRAWATGSAVEVESAARGAATVTVTARDPAGGEAGQSFEVTVPNRAPVSAGELAGRQLYVGERATVEVSGAFSDPDGDPLTFEAVSSDTAVVRAWATGSAVEVESAARGAATVTVTARDPAGGEASQSFEVTVPNRAPVSAGELAGRQLYVGERATVEVSGAFSDPDGDPLTFEAVSSDTAVVRAWATGSAVEVESAARGAATVTVTARDPAGGEASQSFEVTVPNRAPVSAGELAGRQLYVGERATVEVSGAFSDPDGDPLTFEAVSSDTAVVRAWATGSAVEVESAARGAATVTVTARDPAGGEASQSFEVTVPNRAPVSAGELAGRQLYVGERATVEVSGAFSDPDGDPLTFEAVSSDTAVVRAWATGSAVEVESAARGAATVTVTARDPAGGEAGQSFEVTVPNRAPVSAGELAGRQLYVGERATVEVSGAFSDPDGDPLTFEAVSSDTAVVRAWATGSAVEVESAARGAATVTVTARDPAGGEASQSFEVTVPNRAPVSAGDLAGRQLYVGERATVEVSGAFSDPDGDPLTFEAVSSDTAVVRAWATGSAVEVESAARGAATVTVTARDPAGGEAGQSFEVTVPNRAPVSAGELAGRQLYVGERATVEVSGAFSDPDGDPLTFEAVSSDTAVVRAWATGSAVEVESAARGAATVTVTARDPAGGEASQSFEVTVPNRAPVSAGDLAGRQLYVGERATVEVSGAFSDPDGDPLTFEAVSSDTAVVRAWATGSAVEVESAARGAATVTVTARDPAGGEAGQTFEVTVERPVPPVAPRPTNRGPVAGSPMPDLSTVLGIQQFVAVSPYFSDPDGDELRYAGATSNPAVAIVESVAPSALSVTAVSIGEAEITVTATDPSGLSRTQTFTLTVGENTPPEVTGSPPDLTSVPGAVDTVGVSEYFREPDAGDVLTLSVSSSDPGIAEAAIHNDAGSGTSAVVTGVAHGQATLTVTAQDLGGHQASTSFQVSVEANRPPRGVREIDGRYVIPGHSITWNLSLYFSDDGPLSYDVSIGPPPPGLSHYTTATVSLELTGASLTITGVSTGGGSIGVVNVTVTASDHGGESASQSFPFLVAAS